MFRFLRHSAPCAALALACLITPAPEADAARMLIPMYAYPTAGSALWNGVRDASATVDITAIINPANGPGTSVDANYQRRIAELDARGVKLAGYVYTGYGTRPLADVLADMDTFRALYPQVTLLFVDEQSNDAATLEYYAAIHAHAAAAGYARVFGNPGTNTPEAFTTSASIPVTTVIYESPYSGWPAYAADSYVGARPAGDFAMMVTNVGTAARMRECVDLAKARNVDYIYVTHDKGANPYDALPSYWSEETARIAAP